MNDNKMEYQTPQFMPMTDFELQSVNGGGIPVVVFILVAAVTVVEAAFLVGAAVHGMLQLERCWQYQQAKLQSHNNKMWEKFMFFPHLE